MQLNDEHLPPLFLAADSSSRNAQFIHWLAYGFQLAASVVAASLSSIGLIHAAVLFIGLAILSTLFRRLSGKEAAWYGCRAIAESTKTLAWRYAARAEPYLALDAHSDQRFVEDLRAIREKRKSLAAEFGPATGPSVTAELRQIRNETLAGRKLVYERCRLRKELEWYSKKSVSNKYSRDVWFALVLILQVTSLVAVLKGGDGIAIFASVTASAIAWSQARRHGELAQSYAVASHDIGDALAQMGKIPTDKEFSDFVGDAENAISREHTLWLARRDV